MRGLQEDKRMTDDPEEYYFEGQLIDAEDLEILLRMFAISMVRTGHEAVVIERAVFPEHLTLQ